ncbi:MAG: hypothetical protein GY717_04465 [Rhodobacteraceae bacterium]|nr:hypothetical protein [Paracoccaceae bacterium]
MTHRREVLLATGLLPVPLVGVHFAILGLVVAGFGCSMGSGGVVPCRR